MSGIALINTSSIVTLRLQSFVSCFILKLLSFVQLRQIYICIPIILPFSLAHLVFSSRPNLGPLFSYSGRVPTSLPLLVPLDVNCPRFSQPVHLVMHPLELLVPGLFQMLPHLLVLSPP